MSKLLLPHLLALVLVLSNLVSVAQQAQFKGQPVDTVWIRGLQSVYQHDDLGTTLGRSDLLAIVYSSKTNRYFVASYLHDDFETSFKRDTSVVTTQLVESHLGAGVGVEQIQQLMDALSAPVSTKELDQQVDTASLAPYLTRKHIKSVAKRFDLHWYFNKRYETDEEDTTIVAAIQSPDTINTYLLQRFGTYGYLVVTDYANFFEVQIATSTNRFRFEGKHPNPLRQPWYDVSDPDLAMGLPVLNLQINSALYQLLPEAFLLRESISTLALAEDYIIWYFERCGIKKK